VHVRASLVILAAGLCLPAVAAAQRGDIQLGAGAAWVNLDGGSGPILDTGTSLVVDDAVGVEGVARWWVSSTLAAAVSITAAEHDIATRGGLHPDLDAGSVWLVPITATVQYHPSVFGQVLPYVGVGASWAWSSVDTSLGLDALGVRDVDVDSDVGLAALVGVEGVLGARWSAHLEAGYRDLSADATLRDGSGGRIDGVPLDLGQWSIVLGASLRY
jgi:outer membrane protein